MPIASVSKRMTAVVSLDCMAGRSAQTQSKKKPARGGLNYSEFRDPVARRIISSLCESYMKV
jgi:hypothetical protein